MTTASVDRIRSANWSGSIPIVLSLAPTSLSSPTIPPPIHVLIPRSTFLHVSLAQAVRRLYKFAPPTLSFQGIRRVVEEPDFGTGGSDEEDKEEDKADSNNNNNNNNNAPTKPAEEQEPPYPLCWFEDEASEMPLRWQLFTGVLWDGLPRSLDDDKTTTNNPPLPWKIRLHFTSYPSSQILELDASNENGGLLTTVQRNFKNSLKQALFLQYGNSKKAMNMTKQSHQQLWDSIVSAKYSLYKQVNADLQSRQDEELQLIPIRLLVDSSKPPIQKRTEVNTKERLSLGALLNQWIPQYFVEKEEGEAGETTTTIQPKYSSIQWRVSGIVPPLSISVLDLWRSLSHPDHFLYIIVVTQ
jgi:autophagy-related protein 5